MSADATPWEPGASQYAGWIAGALVIVGVMAVGAAFWFMYHPFPWSSFLHHL